MQRRASVLATIVMAPSLVDYAAGKARKAWMAAGAKGLKAQAASSTKAAETPAHSG